MNNTADHQVPESRPGFSRARVWLAVFVTAAVVVVLALFYAGTTRESADPETLVVNEPTSEQSAIPRRSPRPARPEGGATVSPAEPAPSRAPTRSPTQSAEGPVGIHAFPPLGTRPQLTGIIVPDDFELPPGYVRHYQSSDDGQRLAPILMFDPVRPPLDPYGQPMDIPPDRIVPPELAPLGMPIELLELPEPEPDPRSLRGLFGSG